MRDEPPNGEWTSWVEVDGRTIEARQNAYHSSRRLDLQLLDYADLNELPPPQYLDAFMIAAATYAADRCVLRRNEADGWTRRVHLGIAVADPAKFEDSTELLEQALSFLTGDHWCVSFSKARYKPYVLREKLPGMSGVDAFDAICLLSGGLDSLVGAIDWLEGNPAGRLLLVGHHDAATGPQSDQKRLFERLSKPYQNRVSLLQPRVGQRPAGPEPSCRSRSVLFLCLGLLAAGAIGPEVPLFVPENGTIGINIPLIAARRGSCSTRTTHPHFIRDFGDWCRSLGISNPIVNPLARKTKGECLEECRNRTLLQQCVPDTVSCGKRGRRQHWANQQACSCGYCVPCLFRRAALHKIGLDSGKDYGIDVFDRQQLPLAVGLEMSADYTDLLSLLGRHLTRDELTDEIQMNGLLSGEDLAWAAATVERSLREVATWINDVGDQKSIAAIAVRNKGDSERYE